jgi:hypothetical protein
MKVKFSYTSEFCAELEKDAPSVDRQIVRCTNLYEASRLSPNIRHVSFFATYSVGGERVELSRYCGDTWGINEEMDRKVHDSAANHLRTVKEICKRLGLEVRAGLLEEATK